GVIFVGDISNKIKYLRLSVYNLVDLVKLIKLYENVFEMKPFQYPSHEYLKKILKDEKIPFLWLPNMKKRL
ncbi:MAG: hypothetical protein ACXVH2_10900, partial [Methanobacterium sp.]